MRLYVGAAILAFILGGFYFYYVGVPFNSGNIQGGQSVVSTGWKTYQSGDFNFIISIPSDWEEVSAYDGDGTSISEKTFNRCTGISEHCALLSISSPDGDSSLSFAKDDVVLMDTSSCDVRNVEVNKEKARESYCKSRESTIPGIYNYEFPEHHIMVTRDNKTPLTEKIISLIQFN